MLLGIRSTYVAIVIYTCTTTFGKKKLKANTASCWVFWEVDIRARLGVEVFCWGRGECCEHVTK